MNEIFAKITGIGDLFYHNIYLYYDEPLIFSCINKAFQLYFIEKIPPQNDNETWLMVAISNVKLHNLEKNLIDIRSAFTSPEISDIIRIQYIDTAYSVTYINLNQLDDSMLPMPNEFLECNLHPSDVLPEDGGKPEKIAQMERRDVIEISLENEDRHIQEVSCNTLSKVLTNIQQLFYAIAYKQGRIHGRFPNAVITENRLCVAGTFAGSFGIRLKSDEIGNLYNITPLTNAVLDFNHLLSVSNSREELVSFLNTCNPRVILKYRVFIQSLLEHKMGVFLNNASPNRSNHQQRFTVRELEQCMQILEAEINERVERDVFYGNLVGISTDRYTFEFISNESGKFRGDLAASLHDTVFSVPQIIEATIETRISIDSLSQEEKYTYTLVAIQPLVEQTNV